MKLEEYLRKLRKEIDEALDMFFPSLETEPKILHKAMRYSLFAGGKRIRPILCLTVSEGFGVEKSRVMPAACALETLHTYSLVHDDLPAMDNDDLRRGKPTNHKVFGEAVAILVGDALLTLSFDLMSGLFSRGIPPNLALKAINVLARAAGSLGMVGGQTLDIESEKRKVTLAQLKRIHAMKTGALLRTSLEIGAILGGATASCLAKISRFGRKIGLLFQIVDDILDWEGDVTNLGKQPGSDRKKGKATYPNILGMKAAKKLALEAKNQALEILESISPSIPYLAEITEFIYNRKK